MACSSDGRADHHGCSAGFPSSEQREVSLRIKEDFSCILGGHMELKKPEDTPKNTVECDDGWRGLSIQGILDFSLVGVLARVSGILAENEISIFAVSTYNTDYILVKSAAFEKAVSVLEAAGYKIV